MAAAERGPTEKGYPEKLFFEEFGEDVALGGSGGGGRNSAGRFGESAGFGSTNRSGAGDLAEGGKRKSGFLGVGGYGEGGEGGG